MGTSSLVILFIFFGAAVCENVIVDCPRKVPRVKCFNDPCRRATCPADPSARCRQNNCGSCKAEFIDSNGDTVDCEVCEAGVPKLDCEDPCKTASCLSKLLATCKGTRCGECKKDFYMDGKKVSNCGDFSPGGLSCPPGVPAVQCEMGICQRTKCQLKYAKCIVSHCGSCRAIFLDEKGKELNCSGFPEGLFDCPAKTVARTCRNLCAKARCKAHPNAICRVNRCGKCEAEFVDETGVVVNCTKAGSTDCPANAKRVNCFLNPCDVAKCPAHPEAKCVANYCGSCNAAFYDSKGNTLNCEKGSAPNKPRIVKHSKSRNQVRAQKKVRLFCKVSGQPKPKVTWYKGATKIKSCTTKRCPSGYRLAQTKDVSKLVITRMTSSKEGDYSCKAINDYGQVSVTFSVFIK